MSGDGVDKPAGLGDKSAALALMGDTARQPDHALAEGKRRKEEK